MANEIEIVVKGKDQTSSAFASATKSSKEYGKGLEATGESADKGEQKILGLKDTVDGVATIMQGPGKQGIAAYIQGWADLASGVANFIVPAAQGAMAIVRADLAAAKAAVTQKIAAAASKAWAVAQAALNVVMSANPILLVVVAIAALVAGIVIAYQRSEKFRAVVQFLWNALKDGARAAISFVLGMLDKFLGGLAAVLRAMGHLPGPLGAPFRSAANAVEGLRGKVRGLQADINRTRGKTVSIRMVVTQTGAQKVQREIDRITGHAVAIQVGLVRGVGVRGFAHGGITGAAGGGPRSRLTMVGEHGRELVDLPAGSRVRSNPDTERLLSGASGGGTVVLEVHSGGSKLDDAIVEIIRKAVRVKGGGNVQLALGRA